MDELRERLWRVLEQQDSYGSLADVVLDEIEAAGWKLVPPQDGSSLCVGGECWSHDGHEWAGWYDEALDREEQP